MQNTITIHARESNGTPVDVNISYDIFDIIWDRNSGTLTLKHKSAAETPRPVDSNGPAIEGHEIAVINKIEETK